MTNATVGKILDQDLEASVLYAPFFERGTTIWRLDDEEGWIEI